MNKLYAVTLTDLEDANPCKTWIFENKKTAYIFLCNKYEKIWAKYHIPDSKGNYDVIEKKSKYPFVDEYKNNDFVTGEYYNIYFKDNTEIIFGICQVISERINIEGRHVPKSCCTVVDEDLEEAFRIAEQMIKNPDNVTFGDMIWLCRTAGMGKEIMDAKEGTWLDVVESALRKLGYRI